MALFLPRRWKAQPRGPVRLDRGNHFGRRAQLVLLPSQWGSVASELITGSKATAGTVTTRHGPGGHSVYWTIGGASTEIPFYSRALDNDRTFSFLHVGTAKEGNTSSLLRFLGAAYGWDLRWSFFTGGGPGQLTINGTWGGGAQRIHASTITEVQGAYRVLLCNIRLSLAASSSNGNLYYNGVFLGESANFTTDPALQDSTNHRIQGMPITAPYEQPFSLIAVFEGELFDAEARELSANPWQIFKPQAQLFALVAPAGPITVTIGTGGTRDYTSIQAAWNALPSTFANDYVFECYNDGMLAGLNLASSSKTMGSFTLTIRPAAGEGFADHADAATNPLWFDQTKGVAFEASSFLGQVFDLSTAGNTVYLSGIQIRNSHAGRAVLGNASVPLYADNCIFEGAAGAGNNGEVFRFGGVTNCLVVTRSTDGDGIVGEAFHYWRNNTVVAPNGSSGRGLRHEAAFTNLVTGNAVFGFATAFQGSNWGGSSSHNATSTGTTVGSNGLTSLTFADQFVSTTNDFRVKAGADLIDAGVYDASIDPDIVGKARHATTPTIGAWEYLAGAIEPWPLIFDGETLSTVLARINALDDQLTPLTDGVTFGQIRARINELNTGLTPLANGASFLTVRNRINELIQLRNEGG
jgi:hypothetical protein